MLYYKSISKVHCSVNLGVRQPQLSSYLHGVVEMRLQNFAAKYEANAYTLSNAKLLQSGCFAKSPLLGQPCNISDILAKFVASRPEVVPNLWATWDGNVHQVKRGLTIT